MKSLRKSKGFNRLDLLLVIVAILMIFFIIGTIMFVRSGVSLYRRKSSQAEDFTQKFIQGWNGWVVRERVPASVGGHLHYFILENSETGEVKRAMVGDKTFIRYKEGETIGASGIGSKP